MNGPRALVCCAALLLASPAAAEQRYPRHTLNNTQLRTLPRAANGRDYLLYVALPYSYGKEPARRYPVLYICDGYWDFTLLNGFYGNLIYDRVVPEYILVGIGYQGEQPDYDSLRRYDYTPVPDPDQDPKGTTSGHAAAFLGVLEKEIIPFVEKEYRVDPGYRVLGGSSLGGLFSIYAMYTRPGLFQGHIAPSPAVSWGRDWLFEYEKQFAAGGKALDTRLFLTGAAEEWPEFLTAILRFHAQVSKRTYGGSFTYQWRLIDGERHTGTKAESYNRGVRFTFAPRAPRD
jgi:uncharacterized protein